MNFADNGVEVTFSGTFDTDELVEAKTKVWEALKRGEIRYQIINLGKVEGAALRPEQAAQFRKMDELIGMDAPPCRIALVVSTEIVEASAQAYAQDTDVSLIEVELFADLAEARAWAQGRSPAAPALKENIKSIG